MWTSILAILNKVGDFFVKALPMIFAYKIGKDAVRKDAMEDTIKKKEQSEKAQQETKTEIRDKGVSDYVRNNKI